MSRKEGADSKLAILIASGLLACSAALLLGNGALQAADAPHAVVSEPRYDFGALRQGEKVSHCFAIRNDGSVPLEISRMALSLPGMTARSSSVISPGESDQICIDLDTSSLSLEINATARLDLNDPAQPRITLVLHGRVKQPIDMLPLSAVFAAVFKGEGAERHVRIENNEPEPLNILRLEPEGEHFKAAINTLEAGRVYDLVVDIPPDVPSGRYGEFVNLDTDNQKFPRLRVGVNIFVKTDVYAFPEAVDFGVVSVAQLTAHPELAGALAQSFLLKKRAGTFRILSIESDVPALRITQTPDGDSGTFSIEVTLIVDKLRPGPLAGQIRLKTTDSEFPEFVVPVRGSVP